MARLLGKLKLSLVSSHAFQKKAILILILFLVSFVCTFLVSLNSSRLKFGYGPRNLLGLRRPKPKVCSKLTKQDSINWNYYYYYKNAATDQGLIWCKVPKAGSTTLTKLFLRLAGQKHNKNTTRVHKLLRDFYPRLPNGVMLDRSKFTKTFVVVRDPFERLLSAYRDKLENYERDLMNRDGYYYEHFGKFMVKRDNSSQAINGTKKEPTWNEFVAYLIKTPVSKMDEHWQPITRLCSPCSFPFSYIVKMEHFDSEIQQPLRSAGITAIDLDRQNSLTGRANKNLVYKYFKMLTIGEVKKLYTKYKRDFLLFDYSPYKYFRLFSTKNTTKTGYSIFQ